ncbi:DUF928 domain-containing protein [Gloeocapsa sp. PCC 73106]|uniref:DUF928 domain-containing protein n=1 Tax=Gloeocapsa sp. PCC 73106 TaxID=102232 RepID=UPI0002D38DBF|nr:DUF928 domain-containing protein [Gloeocapsa sp. PCC 73106]
MLKLILLIITLNFTLSSFVLAQANLPKVPETGKPETEARPGGTRTGNLEDNSCNSATSLNPVSLLAQGSRDFTASEFPSFWFYLPYTQQQVENIEFILKNPEGEQIIYRTSVELTNQPGIRKVSLPSQPEYALALDTDYLWELIIYCQANDTPNPDIKLEGWITRVEITGEETAVQPVYQSYIAQDILYDAVTQLAQLYHQNPDDQQYQADWKELLELLGYVDLIEKPLVLDVP